MKKPIYVVLGLPRSGTSLMMQMLLAGGIPLHCESFISGESSDIFKLPKETNWLKKCHGQAIKILEPLVFVLPRTFEYRFIVMHRNPAQQAKSFEKFMRYVGAETDHPKYLETLESSFVREMPMIVNKYQMYPGRLKEISFEKLIENPIAIANELQAFLNQPLNVKSMAAIVQARSPDCLPNMLEMDLISLMLV